MSSVHGATREATHAGAWYSDEPTRLNALLSKWFSEANSADVGPTPQAKAVIAPHAGMAYSGRTAAHAYAAVDNTLINRIVILGPSHHVHLSTCALSPFSAYATPLGALPIDKILNDELRASGKFGEMSRMVDEDEHSFEMHAPFIRKIFDGKEVKIVPIMVGSITQQQEKDFGRVLAPYLADPHTLFAVSTDFCHWGSRFGYTLYRPPAGSPNGPAQLGRSAPGHPDIPHYPLHQSISDLDHEAMALLRAPADPATHDKFTSYLKQWRNTICGRHALGILVAAFNVLREEGKLEGKELGTEWVHYAQSGQAKDWKDSSVSYAGGWVKAV